MLIDNCVPRKFARLITEHDVTLARQIGWHELQNGNLIAAAEEAGFDAMVTTDKSLRYQQNLAGRRMSIVVMSPLLVFFESLPPMIGQLMDVLDDLEPGAFIVIRPEGEP